MFDIKVSSDSLSLHSYFVNPANLSVAWLRARAPPTEGGKQRGGVDQVHLRKNWGVFKRNKEPKGRRGFIVYTGGRWVNDPNSAFFYILAGFFYTAEVGPLLNDFENTRSSSCWQCDFLLQSFVLTRFQQRSGPETDRRSLIEWLTQKVFQLLP